MRWPRGRYNGMRIVGFEVKLHVDLLNWRMWGPTEFTKTVALGPFRVWLVALYDERDL